MTTSPLENMTALVTGGSRGIGKDISLRLAAEGAAVAVNYKSNAAAAEQTVSEIEQAGGRAIAAQADVSQPDEVERLVSSVSEQLGPIDILINNAGIFDRISHEETDWELWRRTISINLDSAFLATWAVKESMIERKFGRIVNISSIAGLRPRGMAIAYAASKHGMIGFSRSVAEALAPHNIRVNAVAPGLIDTEILDHVDDADLQALVDATPIPRIGTVEDISRLVFFLVSDQSDFITGQTVVASGGRVTLP